MKTVQFSKFSIFIISIFIFAIGVYVIIAYTTSYGSNNNERIYLQSSNYQTSFEGYVRIQDMTPNGFGVFTYPNSYNFTDSANAYQRFMLIRLPAWMGGDKNDISSYRAYSMLDLDSHCIIKYWPQDQRQRIEDYCHSEMYRVMDGASYFPGVKFFSKPVDNALPELDLGADSSGYIYVKPPIWTADKNGLVGDGRHLSKEQILQVSKILLDDYKKTSRNDISFPLELVDKTFLIDITQSKNEAQFRYASENMPMSGHQFGVVFCNCTGTIKDVDPYGDKNIQAWKAGNATIYASPYGWDIHNTNNYVFQFFKNEHKIVFYSNMEFGSGMSLVLDTFFNGTKLSDLEQIPVDNG